MSSKGSSKAVTLLRILLQQAIPYSFHTINEETSVFLEKYLKINTNKSKKTNFLKINLIGKKSMVQKWKCIRKKNHTWNLHNALCP